MPGKLNKHLDFLYRVKFLHPLRKNAYAAPLNYGE